jgi:hypothetical protein
LNNLFVGCGVLLAQPRAMQVVWIACATCELRAWLNRPGVPLHLPCVCLVLSLPSLTIGLQADDYVLADLVRLNPFGAFEFVRCSIGPRTPKWTQRLAAALPPI